MRDGKCSYKRGDRRGGEEDRKEILGRVMV